MGTAETMLDIYIVENSKLLETLEEMMLDSEKQDDLSHDKINEIFRTMHTIKGSSAMMGYSGLTKLTHGVEEVFSVLRQSGEVPEDIRAELFDLVLDCVDFMKDEMATISEGLMPEREVGELHQRAMAMLKRLPTVEEMAAAKQQQDAQPVPEQPAPVPAGPPPVPMVPKEQESDAMPEVVFAPSVLASAGVEAAVPDMFKPDLYNYFYAHIYFDAGCSMESIRAFAVANVLKDYCERLASIPEDLNVNSDEYIINNGLMLYLKSKEDGMSIQNKLEETMFLRSMDFTAVEKHQIPEKCLAVLNEGGEAPAQADAPAAPAAPVAAPAPSAAAAPAEEKPKLAGIVSMPTATAEKAQAEETAKQPPKPALAPQQNATHTSGVTQNYLSVNVSKVDKLMDIVGEIVTSESMVIENSEIQSVQSKTFEKDARRLRQLTDELQDIVMSIRMVPISATFRKMERIVRDMSKTCGKKATLILKGEQTEIDKKVAETLSDPLMHMIRNSMDHGIEPLDVRRAAGKPDMGIITLEARNTGGDITIVVSDDGGGLDRAAIAERARERGLTAKAESALTDQEVYGFIMEPGFSTNAVVTEYSGRGVGMDVVRSNIAKVGGSIVIDSERGRGTSFTLHIPMTLAIIAGMTVQVGTEQYILPLTNIRESFKPKTEDIVIEPDGSESIMVRNRCCRVRRLHKMFSVESGERTLENGIAVMLESDNDAICLFVDRIIGEQQAVVKPIPAFINRVVGRLPNISGCTLLGDGSICLILDVVKLSS